MNYIRKQEEEVRCNHLKELKKNINTVSYPNTGKTVWEYKREMNYEFKKIVGVGQMFKLSPFFYLNNINT